MHITLLTEYNYSDPDLMAGSPYWISKSLKEITELDSIVINPAHRLLPPIEEFLFRCKQQFLKFFKKEYLVKGYLVRNAEHIATIFNEVVAKIKTDAILTSHTPLAAAYLETKIPIICWTDSVYAAIANFYPEFRNFHSDTHWDGHFVTKACLSNAKLLIFTSDWAARTAVEFYGISHKKIKVVPFGGNIEITHSFDDVKEMINARSSKCIKLLFVGRNWYRKGGDIAVEVANALHEAGYEVELTLVGHIPKNEVLPSFVRKENFLSKKNNNDLTKLKRLYQEAHFLLLPTRADACPNVFAEANAFGVPCISTYVGGIPTSIKNNINGMTFSTEALVKDYCDYISNLMHNRHEYEALALSAYNEHITRLNWKTSANLVKNLIAEIL